MKDSQSAFSDRSRSQTASSAVEDAEIDLMELIRTLWRGKWTILLATVIAVCLGGYYAIGVAEPDYRSRATLTVEVQGGQVLDIESVMAGASLGSSFKCNTQSPLGIGCCDGHTARSGIIRSPVPITSDQ